MTPPKQGLYSGLLRENRGGGCRPHFFESSVLDKYRDDPNYNLATYRVSTKDGSDVEGSSIQQYVWGHKPDGTPCVVVLLAHLDTLSERDQLHWKANELKPADAAQSTICHRYKRAMLHGEFPDTISGFEAVFLYLREIQKLFEPECLFPNLPDRQPDFLAPLPYNSKKAMSQFAQDLHSLMGMLLHTLSSHINAPENRIEVSKLLREQRSGDLLRLYFRDHSTLTDDIQMGLDALKDLNQWRVQSAHKLVAADADQDYLLIASDLVGRVQYGLRAMLLAFMQAEGKTPDVDCARVLKYCVG